MVWLQLDCCIPHNCSVINGLCFIGNIPLSAGYPLTKSSAALSFNGRLKPSNGNWLFSDEALWNEKRIKAHCCFAGNRTGSPLLIMGCTLGLSRKQTRLHFQLWILGSLRLLESSISFRFWLVHLFTWTIKTFLFWSSRALYHSAHVVCIAHTKIFWGVSNPFLVLWSVLAKGQWQKPTEVCCPKCAAPVLTHWQL